MTSNDSESFTPMRLINSDDKLVLRLTHTYQDTFLLGHNLSEGVIASTYVLQFSFILKVLLCYNWDYIMHINQVWTLPKANKRTNELMRLLLNTHHFMRPYLDRRKLSMALSTFIYQFDLQASYRKFLVFFRVFWICESKVNPFSPSEPRAQLSFSSQNLSVVCLRHCCRWRCRKCLIFSSSSLEPIKLGIKHSCVWRAFKLVQLNCQLLFKGEIRVI